MLAQSEHKTVHMEPLTLTVTVTMDNSLDSARLKRLNAAQDDLSTRGLNRDHSSDESLHRSNSCEGHSLDRIDSGEGGFVECDCDACLLGFDDTQSDGETKPGNQAKLRKAVSVFCIFVLFTDVEHDSICIHLRLRFKAAS